MFKNIALAASLAASAIAFNAQAEEFKVGDLVIDTPYARATMPNAPVSGGYMTIRNTGATADRLTGGKAPFAGMVQIHEMKMEGEVMKMREIEGGLEIPAGGEVVLKPGGYHVMFMQLSEQLKEGETRDVELTFANAGNIELPFEVRNVMPPKGMENMQQNKMQHSN